MMSILVNIILNKQGGNTNINEIKNKYNINFDIDINQSFDKKKLESTHIINDLFTNYNFKNLNYNPLNYNYINYILESINNNINNSDVLILSSLYGEFNGIFNNNININNIDIYDLFEDNIKISQMEYDLIHSKPFKFQCKDYLHQNIIMKNYDYILCNFPTGLKNIIHAECCDKIKQLKIRGTKSEPLILQLIMMSLKINGKAILIVPNTLLNNDSKQHVETREYLINNFNVTRIININNSSILYFERNGTTTKISFEEYNNTNTSNSILFEVYYDKIVKKNYNLYYEKYINNDINNDINTNVLNKYKLKDIIEIIECDENTKDLNYELDYHYLLVPRNYNNNQKITIQTTVLVLSDNYITIKVKNTINIDLILQKYFNYYFYYIISPYILTYTTGKLRKLDIDCLYEIDINIPQLNIQNNIIDYYDKLNKQINQNLIEISNLEELKLKYINLIIDSSNIFIKLKDICTVDVKPNNTKFCIQRNSKIAGNVFMYDDKDKDNTNIYFINDIKNYNSDCLYIILKQSEQKLNKMASITNTINLGRNCLENFDIKDIPIDIQNKLVEQCNIYDSLINDIVTKSKLINNEHIFKFI